MSLPDVIDSGMMFNASFADTSAQKSAALTISEANGQCVVFVAPTGVNVTTTLEVQDPLGTWHAFSSPVTTLDGHCDALPIAFNGFRIRASIVPSAGAGSAVAWGNSGD